MKLFNRKPKSPMANKRIQAERRAFSYYANRTIAPKEMAAKRAQQKTVQARQASPSSLLQRLPSYLLLGVLGISTLYLLSLNSQVKVTQYINPADKQFLRDTGVYQVAARNAIKHSWLNYNKLTIDTRSISESLEQQYPELANVSITLPFFGRKPVMEIVPAKPVLLLVAQNGAFALDQNGKAIIEASNAPGLSAFTLPTINDEAGVTIEVGKNALPKDNVDFITAVLTQLQAKDMHLESATLPAIVNELHIRVEGEPYYIKLNTSSDARQQVGAYLALKEKLDGQKIAPKEYVDVRVEEKVYYK